MQPAPQPAPVAAGAPATAVLVMVDGGRYTVVDPLVLGMHRTDLLRALQQDGIFAKALAGVMLDRCIVTVAASASEEEPSDAEVAASRELKGAATLSRLAAVMLASDEHSAAAAAAGDKPFYLYGACTGQGAGAARALPAPLRPTWAGLCAPWTACSSARRWEVTRHLWRHFWRNSCRPASRTRPPTACARCSRRRCRGRSSCTAP